ncbi:MAG: acyl-CoA dehydrogenase family protein [Polyangiaceae bacterium]
MDFSFDAAQSALHDAMRTLGSRALAAPPEERLDVLAAGGALGLSIAAAHGGGGHDLLTTAHAYEGLGSSLDDGGVLLAAGAHLFGVAMTIQKVGTDRQRATWLPALATGRCLGTVAATESGAGSDVGAVQSSVESTDDGVRLSGEKAYVTSAHRAGLFLFVGQHAGGRGLTVALVPSEHATAGEPWPTAGLRGAGLAPVVFDASAMSAENVLGKPGAGMAVFQTAMTYERALVLAFRLGSMQRGLDESVAHVRRRKSGGVAMAQHQAVQHRIARMKRRLETARLLVYRAAWQLDQGERATGEAALAKWHLAEAAMLSALDALQLRGASGYLDSSGMPGAIDDAIGGTIHSGTEDVLASIVARTLA